MIRRNWLAPLLLLLFAPGLLLAEDAATPPATSEPATQTIEALTEQVKKCVVVVTTAGRDSRNSGMGSGFVISADGLVVTNFHVIGDGRDVQVRLSDGRSLEVTAIHAFDRALDLAVLRVAGTGLSALALGDSAQLKQGQSVV